MKSTLYTVKPLFLFLFFWIINFHVERIFFLVIHGSKFSEANFSEIISIFDKGGSKGVDSVSTGGMTALDYAESKGLVQVASAIREKGGHTFFELFKANGPPTK